MLTPARPSTANMQQKNVYFISDLHLGAGYIADKRRHEQAVVEFLDSIAPTAGELILLGDILDYWYEYRTVVPRGYVRFFGALARLADSGVKITWFIGNHDIWLFDYLRDEIGLEVVDGICVRTFGNHKFLMAHGDGIGPLPLSFRFIRATFRNKVCQKLYAAIHPRWTIPFAHGWSKHSRDMEHYSEHSATERQVEQYAGFCTGYLADTDPTIEYFVFGHLHTAVDRKLPGTDARMIILGDWISHFTYGVFDGRDFRLEVFKHQYTDSNHT